MPRSSNFLHIPFYSSNSNKYSEAAAVLRRFDILADGRIGHMLEIQSDSLVEISQAKAKNAQRRHGGRALVEDAGLFVDGLGGFPGPYSEYAFRMIGLSGLLKLLADSDDRSAKFVAVVTYDADDVVRTFEGTVRGTISGEVRGDGWGYDPVFVPEGQTLTFAEMGHEAKIRISHRTLALEKFAKWYCSVMGRY